MAICTACGTHEPVSEIHTQERVDIGMRRRAGCRVAGTTVMLGEGRISGRG
jgi:hypothetical protein